MQQFNNIAFALIITAIIFVLMRDDSPPVGPGSSVVPSNVSTKGFDGSYHLVMGESFLETRRLIATNDHQIAKQIMTRGLPDPDLLMQNAYLIWSLEDSANACANFRINAGVIRSGQTMKWELSLTSATVTDSTLVGTALLHEDIYDPGDCQSVGVRLERDGDRLKFSYYELGGQPGEPVVLQRTQP